MTRVGVTGHMDLTPESIPLVRDAIEHVLIRHVPAGLTGVSCIAAGADSIFAQTVLDLGGDLEVILPAADYRERKVKPEHAELFDTFVARAARVRVLANEISNRQAYEEANETMVGSVDQLVAVWDGRSPVDQGGTGAVVQYARSRGIEVEIVWPAGASRRSRPTS